MERIAGALADRLQEVSDTLDTIERRHADMQSARLHATSDALDQNLRELIAHTGRRLELDQLERTEISRQRSAVLALLDIAESMVSNASATTTTNIVNLYRLIELGNKREDLFSSLDRMIEVDIDTMERMSEFQLVCVKIQTLFEQLESEHDPQAVAGLHARYREQMATLGRRVQDLRDPNLKRSSQGHYRTLESASQDKGLFAVRAQNLTQRNALQQLRSQGAALGFQLNEQAAALVAASGQAVDLAGKQARSAVDRGFLGFLGVGILLFTTLIVTVWVVFRYHLLRQLSGMEKAARALSTGNYDIDIATSGNDPLAPLGRALVQVKENVRERARLETELRKHQEELEEQVAQRTAELKQSNELLEHEAGEHALARQKAEDANKAKNLFLGSLSHELRTPLSGVSGAAGLLRETGLSARQLEYVHMIGYANSTLLEILEDMLNFSRIEAGKMDLQHASFNLREALEDMLSLQSVPAFGKGIALVSEIDPAVPAFVAGDRGKLNQLLLNIIGNAIKFTDEGQVTVSVGKVGPGAQGKMRLQFSVSDTGIGIPAEKLQDVFKPFFQVEDTAHQRHGGAGLGLAICQRLVEAMGGAISIESVEGQGSIVAFHIDVEALDALPATPHEEDIALPRAQRRLTVLVVEDDAINRRVCARYLELLGHAGVQAEDGSQALAALTQAGQEIDVILMDISLPGRSGLEVAEAIRALDGERWQRIPIIIMSAHVSATTSRALANSGYAAFLGKPFSLKSLSKALNGVSENGSASPAEGGQLAHCLLDFSFLQAEAEVLGEATLSELLKLFRDELPSVFAALDGYLDSRDWPGLGARVHRLRSAAGNLGMAKVIQSTRAIEAAASRGEPDCDALGRMVRQLEAACTDSCEELYDWLLAILEGSRK
ncbi:MAG: ATP-binding protein [Telluria sp.]